MPPQETTKFTLEPTVAEMLVGCLTMIAFDVKVATDVYALAVPYVTRQRYFNPLLPDPAVIVNVAVFAPVPVLFDQVNPLEEYCH